MEREKVEIHIEHYVLYVLEWPELNTCCAKLKRYEILIQDVCVCVFLFFPLLFYFLAFFFN